MLLFTGDPLEDTRLGLRLGGGGVEDSCTVVLLLTLSIVIAGGRWSSSMPLVIPGC